MAWPCARRQRHARHGSMHLSQLRTQRDDASRHCGVSGEF
jgi:hypothetical protein